MRKILGVAVVAVVVLSTLTACKSDTNAPPAADNTARNERDRSVTPTADNGGHDAADRALTQRIRKAVMADGSLSTNAHNCKIVVTDERVTLVGPVASDQERARVAEIATQLAGVDKVTNQLEVTK